MKQIDYEYEAKKNAIKETVLYGLMWILIAALISIIPFLNNENIIVYNAISILLLTIGISKLVKGIRNLKQLLNNP